MFTTIQIANLKTTNAVDYINGLNAERVANGESFLLAIWDEYYTMSAYDFERNMYASMYSDMYKEMRNFRPGIDWRSMTLEELVAKCDSLQRRYKLEIEEEKRLNEEYLAWRAQEEAELKEDQEWVPIQDQYDIQDSLMGF